MKLTRSQINDYHEQGYLIIDGLFTAGEVQVLKEALGKIPDKLMPHIIREDSGAIRTVFATQRSRKEFGWLYKQDLLIQPAQQLLDDASIYLYQYKLNNKKAFGAGVWEWHQDYPFWHIDDGVKDPKMLSVMVLMQDTDHAQGPLMLIPKSHKKGIAAFQDKTHVTTENIKLENSLNGDLKFTVKNELIKLMVNKGGIKSGIGSVGTAIFFHPNLYHGSNAKISPYDRNTAIMTYNVTSNLPEDRKGTNRPDYMCLKDFNPISADERSLDQVMTC